MDYLFSKPSFNCVGDPFVDPQPNPFTRSIPGLRQLHTAPPKRGQTANTIGYGPLQFVPAYLQGKDPYTDTYKVHAKARQMSSRQFRTPTGFAYASPMKRSSSPGDAAGTFGGSIEHVPDCGVKKKPEPNTLRNVQAVPSKRGGCGVAGILIGGKELEYVGCDYDALAKKLKYERQMHRARVGGRRPFSSVTRPRDYFHPTIFTDDARGARRGSTAPSKPTRDGHVFRPSSPSRSGYNSTLTPFPETVPEQFDDHERRRAILPDRRHPVKDAFKDVPVTLRDRKPFRPSSGPRSAVTRSIAVMRPRSSH